MTGLMRFTRLLPSVQHHLKSFREKVRDTKHENTYTLNSKFFTESLNVHNLFYFYFIHLFYTVNLYTYILF